MHIETGNTHKRLHKSTLIFGIVICTFSLIIAALGIWLVYLKSVGATKFSLFGQEFASNNVGIAAIFIGAVSLVFSLRRVLKSLDKIADNYSQSSKDILESGKNDHFIRK